ncbi:unnamed protein product [Linum tenue]|uniref:Major facilitator superfamily (MFS) profile domain-containing protein n=1 Tax=Linum tenue TaxID=586396 RepID=A0AAV0M6K8_9ROSI|nr:unnamed protein product [Linum tenue]
MVLGGLTFFAGGAINGGAVNVAMLILGRILLGLGVGFTNQAAPLYLSEVAPAKCGVVASNFLNFFLSKHPWGWRLSLGLAVVPAAIMTLGAALISDTPSSLVERGRLRDAKQSLIRIRGAGADVEGELDDLVRSVGAAKAADREPFVTILERRHRPQLVMAVAIPFFQQVTGINIIVASRCSFVRYVGSDVVFGIILKTGGSVYLFDLNCLIWQLAVAAVLVAGTGASGTEHISKELAVAVLILLCTYGAGFGWSWGPLSWLIPSEIFPIKIRTTGQGISQAVNFATTFALSQSFLAMLCHLKYGAFLFYAGWIATMTLFVMLFLPETKGIPLDSMQGIWEQHWYWRRFVSTTVSA